MNSLELCQIVACDQQGVIGKDGHMPWHLRSDLQYFKECTSDHIVIMGRKTFESIGKPLPNRLNLIVTRNSLDNYEATENLRFCSSIEQALAIATQATAIWGTRVFIIGGGEIYRQTIDLCDLIYLTRVDVRVDGDTSYPLDRLSPFHRIACSDVVEENGFRFQFETWQRTPQ